MRNIPAEFSWPILGLLAALIVSAFVSLQFGLFIIFFATLAWWVWQRPVGGFYLFIVAAPLLPMLKITQTIGTITLLKDVIIATLVTKLLIIPLLTKQLPYRRNPFILPIGVLVLWTGLNVFRADDFILGVLRAREIVLYILLGLAVIYLPRTREFYRQALLWFSLSATIVVALSAYQWWLAPDSAVLRFDPVRSIWIPRISSILAHPSILGEYLVGVASFALALFLTWQGRARLAALGGLLVLLPVIFLTYSRAVWLGLVAAVGAVILAFLWHVVKRRSGKNFVRWLATTVVVGVATLALLIQFTPVGTFVRTAFDPTYGSNEERLEFLARLIAPLTPTEALVGRGLGDVTTQNFRSVPVTTFDVTSGAARTVQLAKNATLVDNQFLKSFVELGLAGVLISLWLYGLVAKAAWGLAGNTSHVKRVIGFASLGFMAAFVVQAFFIDIWDIFPTNAFFWIIVALVARNLGATSDTDQPASKPDTATKTPNPAFVRS